MHKFDKQNFDNFTVEKVLQRKSLEGRITGHSSNSSGKIFHRQNFALYGNLLYMQYPLFNNIYH